MMATQKKTRIKEHNNHSPLAPHHHPPANFHPTSTTSSQHNTEIPGSTHTRLPHRFPVACISSAPQQQNLNPKDSSTRPGCYLPLPPSPCPSQTAGTIRRNTPKSTAMSWSTSSRYTSFQYTSSLVQKGLSILQL